MTLVTIFLIVCNLMDWKTRSSLAEKRGLHTFMQGKGKASCFTWLFVLLLMQRSKSTLWMEWKVPLDLRWRVCKCVCNCVLLDLVTPKTIEGMEYRWTVHHHTIHSLWPHFEEKLWKCPFFSLLLMGGVKNHENHMVGPIWLLFDTSMEIGGMPCTHEYRIENIER